MRLPPLASLRAFEAAARLGSFAAAARELGLTPSAISHQVRLLEVQLQRRLFVREGRGVALTPSGRAYADAVIAGFDRIRQGGAAMATAADGLRLTTQPMFASEILLPALEAFERRNPAVRLQVEINSRLVDFYREPVDVGIRYGAGDWAGLFSEPLLAMTSAPALSPELLARIGPFKGPADILPHTLIIHDPAADAWDAWAAAAGLTGFAPVRTIRFDTLAGAVRAAEDGLGLALPPLPMIAMQRRGGRLVVPFATKISSRGSYFFVCREGEQAFARVRLVRRWLQSLAAQYRAVRSDA